LVGTTSAGGNFTVDISGGVLKTSAGTITVSGAGSYWSGSFSVTAMINVLRKNLAFPPDIELPSSDVTYTLLHTVNELETIAGYELIAGTRIISV
jgi:hypothetical protein